MPGTAKVVRPGRRLILVVAVAFAQACSSPTSPALPAVSSTPSSVTRIAPAAGATTPVPLASSGNGATRTAEDLGGAISHYLADPFIGNRYRNLRALIVTVNGRTMFERYYHSSASAHVNVQSEGKTIIGTLIGIALAEKRLRSLDERLPELLPSYTAQMTPQDKVITLRQLLTMTAGMPRDEVFYPRVFDTGKDWVRQILGEGPDFTFGRGFSYSSAGSHLLSVILSEATGRSTLSYARTKLFEPIGISTAPASELVASTVNLPAYERAGFAWPTDPQGHHIGGGGMKLTARDMVKLGQLWLAKGKWQGRQVVPADWLAQSQRRQVPTDGDPSAYGFQQWVTVVDDHPAFAALGFGGQVTEVVPDLGLVVVSLAVTPTDPLAPLEPEPPTPRTMSTWSAASSRPPSNSRRIVGDDARPDSAPHRHVSGVCGPCQQRWSPWSHRNTPAPRIREKTVEYALEAEGLTKSFGTTQALAGVDLAARAGTVLGVLGPNGAGKTTAVRILATLLRADSGHATIAGYDVVDPGRTTRCARPSG